MSVKDIRREFERLADKGVIAEKRVMPLTLSMVVESATQQFHRAYYGDLLDTQIQSVRTMDHEATESAMRRVEGLITDMTRFRNAHQETHTTSDFPLALAYARQAAQRPGSTFPESDLPAFAQRRTADNFMPLQGTRPGSLSHRVLPVRPESTNVQYANFYTTEDGYTIANYELALEYTWEAYRNDDIGRFAAAAAALGDVARRTRAWVLLDAIFRQADRIPMTDGEFGATPENLDAAAEFMAARTTDGKRTPKRVTDIFVPTNLERQARRSVDTEFLIATGGAAGTLSLVSPRNPAYQLGGIHVEDLITEFAAEYQGFSANDYIVMDGRNRPLEFAALRGYEGGPKTFTRVTDVVETDLEGNFENHLAAMKVADNVGGFVRDTAAVAVVQGD